MVAERQRAVHGQGSISPHPGGRYRVRLNLKGVKKSKVVGSRKEAVAMINLWHSMDEEVETAPVPGSDMLFIDLIPEWSAAMEINKYHGTERDPRPMALSTLQSFHQKIDCYIRHSPLVGIKVGDLTSKDIRTFTSSLTNGTWATAKRVVIDEKIAALPDDNLRDMWHKKLKAQRPRKLRYSNSIQRQCFAIISDVLDYALVEEYIDRNVSADISPVAQMTNAERDAESTSRKVEKHGYEMDPKERRRILDTARNNEKHTRLGLRWVLMMEYGLRPGEALGLCIEDYDRNKRILTIKRQVQHKTGVGVVIVPRVKTKSGEREIHVGPDLHKMIMARRRAILAEQDLTENPNWEPYIFEGRTYNLLFAQKSGRVISQRLDDTYWKKLLVSAKVPPVRRYVGRHSAASHMMSQPGVDVMAVSALMGHSDPAFTQRVYTHALDEAKRRLAAQIEAASRQDVAETDPYALYEVDEDRA